MNNTLVFCSLAIGDTDGGSVNIVHEDKRKDIYFENTFVALKTIKNENPDISVALITNSEVPEFYEKLFKNNDILIHYAPFDTFVFPSSFRWSLAFYKMSSMKWAIENLKYDNYVQIDCDVVCNGSLEDMLNDIEYGVMMLSGPFTYSHSVRSLYREIYEKMYNEKMPLYKWGSGLIAGKREHLKLFFDNCFDIYKKMQEFDIPQMSTVGDEFITSVAAIHSEIPIVDGKAYMHVYWTGLFYLTSTNYTFDKIVLLHLPVEKEIGIHSLFKYYIKHGKFPSKKKMYVWLSLPKLKNPYFRSYVLALIRKIKRLFK